MKIKWPFVLRSSYEALRMTHTCQAEVLEAIIFDNRNLRKTNSERVQEIERLQADLIQAQKNDKRDPKTGRYIRSE